jgi:bifunctional enzyme CysN/CysC
MHSTQFSNELTRVVFCGAVDDGKSTLMGRLLVETGNITVDEIAAAERQSSKGGLDFSLLVDGLQSEREQGITIDVAHRHLTLPDGTRTILADSPGHEQYTRNMAVASSSADVAVVVLDAQRGIRDQTLRHCAIAALMGVHTIIVAINKLDAVDDSDTTFENIKFEIRERLNSSLTSLGITGYSEQIIIGVSGLLGYNISKKSNKIPSGDEQTLLAALTLACKANRQRPAISMDLRLPVQAVLRKGIDRTYLGRLAQGTIHSGDTVTIWPSMGSATIKTVSSPRGPDIIAGDAVAITLTSDTDVGRGDVILKSSEGVPPVSRAHLAHLVWLHPEALQMSTSYLLKVGTTEIPARIERISYILDLPSGNQIPSTEFDPNTVGCVEVTVDRPLLLDPYRSSRDSGGFILVDRLTGETVAAGMAIHPLLRESDVSRHEFAITRKHREELNRVRAKVLWLTGLSGSGKSTIADEVERRLHIRGIRSFVLDGDSIRQTLSEDLGFSPEDRRENVRRVSRVAQLMVDAGLVVIVSLVSPFAKDRAMAREMFAESDFVEIFVDTPIEICKERDPKGLYSKALANGGEQMTGVGQQYERPETPEFTVDGTAPVEESAVRLVELIIAKEASS